MIKFRSFYEKEFWRHCLVEFFKYPRGIDYENAVLYADRAVKDLRDRESE